MILVGMKSDADKDRKVSIEEGMGFAEKHAMSFLEVSAKNGTNVREVFETSASTVLSKITQGIPNENRVKPS